MYLEHTTTSLALVCYEHTSKDVPPPPPTRFYFSTPAPLSLDGNLLSRSWPTDQPDSSIIGWDTFRLSPA